MIKNWDKTGIASRLFMKSGGDRLKGEIRCGKLEKGRRKALKTQKGINPNRHVGLGFLKKKMNKLIMNKKNGIKKGSKKYSLKSRKKLEHFKTDILLNGKLLLVNDLKKIKKYLIYSNNLCFLQRKYKKKQSWSIITNVKCILKVFNERVFVFVNKFLFLFHKLLNYIFN